KAIRQCSKRGPLAPRGRRLATLFRRYRNPIALSESSNTVFKTLPAHQHSRVLVRTLQARNSGLLQHNPADAIFRAQIAQIGGLEMAPVAFGAHLPIPFLR